LRQKRKWYKWKERKNTKIKYKRYSIYHSRISICGTRSKNQNRKKKKHNWTNKKQGTRSPLSMPNYTI
jgi:hypothetical protein